MDNKAKIYTLYFVFEDTVTSIGNIVNNREDSREKLDGDRLFHKFLMKGKKQYSDLHYDIVCEIGSANYKAEQEFARIGTRIKSFLGDLRDGNNVDLVFALWIALELALSFYFSICENQPNLVYDLEDKLRLGHQKYLSSQSNSEGWQNTDLIITSKVGNF
ncbi:hypothetical protein [Argonema antarcticum]|uniref:hypothetical protein n=1 Tax=Argonema antarcticum TaxID=2942763 RepID=UPI002011615F|nr:hypothetical protein [Argonema antarcticum]MCL1472915.1 hypothetical protein [Argonema antarcticum A004/B2]